MMDSYTNRLCYVHAQKFIQYKLPFLQGWNHSGLNLAVKISAQTLELIYSDVC